MKVHVQACCHVRRQMRVTTIGIVFTILLQSITILLPFLTSILQMPFYQGYEKEAGKHPASLKAKIRNFSAESKSRFSNINIRNTVSPEM